MANAANLAMIIKAQDEASPVLDKVSGNVEGFGQKVSGLGTAMSGALAGFGAGIGLAAFEGISSGISTIAGAVMDADASVGQLQAKLGLTREEAQSLGDVAQNVFRNNFGADLGEVNSAVATVQQNLGKLSPELTQQATESALAIKGAFGASEQESTRTASVMMKNFQGLSQTDAFDIITAGFQKGGDFSDELLDTLREYAPQFANLGLNAEQAMGVLIAGAQSGAFNLDKVGDAAKEFNIRAQDGSKATAEGFKAIGLDATQMGAAIAQGGPAAQNAFQMTLAALAAMEDPLARNQAGVALFGTQWEDLGPTVVMSMAEGLKGLDGFQGSTQRAADAMAQGIGPALEGLKRQLIGLGVDAIMPLMPTITGFVTGLTSGIQTTIPIVRELAKALADIFSGGDSYDTASEILDRMFPPEITDGILEFTRQLGDAWRTVVQVFTEGWEPSEAVEPLSNAMGSLALVVRDIVIPAVQEMAAFIMEQLGVVVDWVRANWPLIQETIATVLRAIQAFWAEHGEQIMTIVRAAWEIVKTVLATGLANILDTVKMVLQIINGDWAGAWETARGILQRTVEAWGTILSAALDIILASLDFWTGGMVSSIKQWMTDTGSALRTGMEAVETAISNGWDAVKSAVSNILPTIKAAVMAMWNALPEDIRTDLVKIADHITTQGAQWVTNLTTAGSNMLTSITTKLGEMVTAVATWATSTFLTPIIGLALSTGNAMTTAGSSMLTAITGRLAEIVTAVTAWADSTFLAPLRALVGTARAEAARIGQSVVDGIAGAITAGAGIIRDAAYRAARAALDAAIAIIQPGSPSKVFTALGETIPQGMALGIYKMTPMVADAALAMAEAARQAAMGASRPVISSVLGQLGATIGQGVSPAIRQFGQLASGSIVPGQIGGGGQYGLIPIGPGTIQPTTTTMQPYRADSYQEHDITVRVGDIEAARIYAVGKDLSVRIRGEG